MLICHAHSCMKTSLLFACCLFSRHCRRGAAAGRRRCRPRRKGYRRDQCPGAERIRLQPGFCRPAGDDVAPAGTGGQGDQLRWPHREPVRPAAGGERQRFLHLDPPRFDRRGLAAALGWEGQAQTYTEVKRGYGIFVSAQNPALATSLRCASTIGAMMRRAGFALSTWHARKHTSRRMRKTASWYHDNLVVLYRTRLPAVSVRGRGHQAS